MKQPSKNKKQGAPGPGLPAPVGRTSPMRWVMIGLVLLLTTGATWAIFEHFVWATTPSQLVGKWVVTEGPDEGGTVDFYRNGTMIAKVNNQGFEGIIEAKIRVEDNKIHVTTRHQRT